MPSARSSLGLELMKPTSCISARKTAASSSGSNSRQVRRQLGQRLERVVVPAPRNRHRPDGARRFPVPLAEIGALEEGAQEALGGNRMIADQGPVARQDAAEILRPGLVRGRVEDDAADLAGAQLLRLGRKARKASTFPRRTAPWAGTSETRRPNRYPSGGRDRRGPP